MNREEWDARLLAFWQNEPLDEKEREEIRHWLQESEQHRCYYRQLQKSYLRQRWIMREPLIRRKEERRHEAACALPACSPPSPDCAALDGGCCFGVSAYSYWYRDL
ncbi:MAG: hypothetical protein BHV68_10650 [Bacteroidales bacterium 43_8]|nr:MAG: hypothetical protein BHV68_10650 [Bacteroidales bacterium 43_8]